MTEPVDGPRLSRLLSELRVDYLLLQDTGIGVMQRAEMEAWRDAPGVSVVMRRLFERELAFRQALAAVAAGGRLLYHDAPLRLIALPR